MRTNLGKSNQQWDLRTKVKRAVWNAVQLLLFRPTPKRRGNAFRVFLLRRFGAKIHGTPLIHQTCRILLPWELEVGEESAIGNNVEIYNYARVSIGPMTMISQYTYLCTGSHDYEHPHMPLIWAPITVGSECWVAAGVFVGPGVEIGNGTVIGARSVVTKPMPPWMVCAGNPCRPIKARVIGGDEGPEAA
jgi:putative colanic acid biosynthesis acetyltransferase WcaF